MCHDPNHLCSLPLVPVGTCCNNITQQENSSAASQWFTSVWLDLDQSVTLNVIKH